MYCRNCGAEHPDTAEFCPTCGVATAGGGAYAAPVTYAGFWRRFAAWVIDSLILIIPAGIAGMNWHRDRRARALFGE